MSRLSQPIVSPSARRRHHVVIVGGGFGGLFAAKALRRGDIDVTLVDRTNHHLFQPLLYQLATGILSEGDIAPPIRDLLRRQRNARVVLGEVIAVDLDARRVTVDAVGERSEIGYDSLIVAAGARQSYFGHPEFAHDAPGMKTIDDALELRGRIFGAFEMAEREIGSDRATPLAHVCRRRGGPDRRRAVGAARRAVQRPASTQLPPHRSGRGAGRPARRGPAILPAYPEVLRDRAAQQLEDMGVEVQLHTMVTGVDERGIDTNSIKSHVRRIEAATKIWAAGVQRRRSEACSRTRQASSPIRLAGSKWNPTAPSRVSGSVRGGRSHEPRSAARSEAGRDPVGPACRADDCSPPVG
jgi:NADH dehydrogenase